MNFHEDFKGLSPDIAAQILIMIEQNEEYKSAIRRFIELLDETRLNWKKAAMESYKLREENWELKKALNHTNGNVKPPKKRRISRVADFTCSDLDEVDCTLEREEPLDVLSDVKVELLTPEHVNFVQSAHQSQEEGPIKSSDSNQYGSSYEEARKLMSDRSRFQTERKIRRSNSVPDCLELDTRRRGSDRKMKATVERTPSLNVTSKSGLENVDGLFEEEDDAFLMGDRSHEFQQRRNFTNVDCSSCRRTINFGLISVRCMVCRLCYHQDCSRRNIMPCMPRRAPKKKQQKQARLGDYCPDIRPMIPQIVGFCCIQIERSETNLPLYQIPGSQEEVQKLLSAFMKKDKVPKLEDFGVLTISDTVKRFLSNLKQPLVPLGYHAEFKGAAQMVGGEKELIQQISALPQAHCDTLAYFCRHLKRLNESSDHQNLSVTSLAEALAPVIFGTGNSLVLSNKEAALITARLIQLPADDLQQLLGGDNKLNRVPSDHLRKRRRSFQGHSPLLPVSSITVRRK
uniref:Rac GTPase activating protein 1 n=1 Tax=Bursaphelenchus xylophilus TaxID=6326 RepID=A0A1I7S8S4_BURXY